MMDLAMIAVLAGSVLLVLMLVSWCSRQQEGDE